MGNGDYLPRQDGELVTWLNQFGTQLVALGTTLGVTTADTDGITSSVSAVQSAVQEQLAKRAAAKSATAAKKQTLSSTLRAVRAIVKRIKSNPAYTTAIGQQLGIVGATMDGMSLNIIGGLRPELSQAAVRNGSVEVRFRKNGYSGVLIACRRGAEIDYTTLGKQMYSPFVDERLNLGGGPETRLYQAWFLDGDKVVGEASDILVVTVPEAEIPAA